MNFASINLKFVKKKKRKLIKKGEKKKEWREWGDNTEQEAHANNRRELTYATSHFLFIHHGRAYIGYRHKEINELKRPTLYEW